MLPMLARAPTQRGDARLKQSASWRRPDAVLVAVAMLAGLAIGSVAWAGTCSDSVTSDGLPPGAQCECNSTTVQNNQWVCREGGNTWNCSYSTGMASFTCTATGGARGGSKGGSGGGKAPGKGPGGGGGGTGKAGGLPPKSTPPTTQ